MAKLGDIFVLQMGKTPARANNKYWNNGDNPWVSISDLSNYGKYVGKTKETISNLAVAESGIKAAPANTVIMSFKLTLGKTAITVMPTYTNEAIMAFVPKGNYPVYPSYFYHFFSGRDWSKGTNRAVMGTTLNKATLNEIDIAIPSFDDQVKIAELLDKLDSIVSLRKQQLSKLDELVKSRFIELFGNNDYPTEPLDNNVIEMFIGPFGSSLKNEVFVDEEDGFCMVYEQKHAIQKTMDVPTRYVPQRKYVELKRFTILGGDIIVSCRGTIGEIFIVPDDAPMGIMHPSIMKIRLNTEKYNQKFFVFALEQYMVEHNAEAKGSGVKMAVSATVLGQSDFVVPPMKMQNRFATFVEQVDKSKLAIQKSLEKLEILKKSLMQKYFG